MSIENGSGKVITTVQILDNEANGICIPQFKPWCLGLAVVLGEVRFPRT